MATTLAASVRLIEYPDDISGCKKLRVEGRDLLYYVVQNGNGASAVIVVLGYESGQKQDIVTKDLIETIEMSKKEEICQKLLGSLALDSNTRMLFL